MTKDITLGQITYHIYTEFDEGFYWGCWVNLGSGDKWQSSKACDTEEDALEAGEWNARMDYGYKYLKRGTGNS